MVLEWKEREHNEVDALALEDDDCMNALRDCRSSGYPGE